MELCPPASDSRAEGARGTTPLGALLVFREHFHNRPDTPEAGKWLATFVEQSVHLACLSRSDGQGQAVGRIEAVHS